jgi:hypothetical protein
MTLKRRPVLLSLALALGLVAGVFLFSDTAQTWALKARLPKWNPPPGVDRYDAKLRHVFADAYAPEVELRCLMTGGDLEIVLFVRRDEVVLLSTLAGRSVWDHEHRELVLEGKISGTDARGRALSVWQLVQRGSKPPASLDHYPLKRAARPLSPPLKEELRAVWRDALDHAKRDQNHTGLDGGTTAYFLRAADGSSLSGSIWSPDLGPAKALNEVGHALLSFTLGGGDEAAIRDAIAKYRDEAGKRAPGSLELDFLPDDLRRRPPR